MIFKGKKLQNIRKEVISAQLLYHDSKTRKLLHDTFPNFTREDFIRESENFKELSIKAGKKWNAVVENEFKKIFGREYQPWDYQVSGVARDEFSDDIKDKLRSLAFEHSENRILSSAFLVASRYIKKK